MLTLLIRSDKPEAELYLFDENLKISEFKWQAHRELGQTIHVSIEKLLSGCGKSLTDLEKVGVYEGPGSFTGLRIGVSVANALAYSLNLPVVSATGVNWIKDCLSADLTGFIPVSVVYGSEPHITQQKK